MQSADLDDAHGSDVLQKDLQLSPPVEKLYFQGSACPRKAKISSLTAAYKPGTCSKCHNLQQYRHLLSQKKKS